MEKPSWAPFVITGALPHDSTDLLAIMIIALTGLQGSLPRLGIEGSELGLLVLILVIPATCALASLSSTTRKLREELAILAYGGSWWQVWVRHFLRGFICSLIALLPFMATEAIAAGHLSQRALVLLSTLFLGGALYAGSSLRRVRSLDFAENYKA